MLMLIEAWPMTVCSRVSDQPRYLMNKLAAACRSMWKLVVSSVFPTRAKGCQRPGINPRDGAERKSA
jgi:hypothetical protein